MIAPPATSPRAQRHTKVDDVADDDQFLLRRARAVIPFHPFASWADAACARLAQPEDRPYQRRGPR